MRQGETKSQKVSHPPIWFPSTSFLPHSLSSHTSTSLSLLLSYPPSPYLPILPFLPPSPPSPLFPLSSPLISLPSLSSVPSLLSPLSGGVCDGDAVLPGDLPLLLRPHLPGGLCGEQTVSLSNCPPVCLSAAFLLCVPVSLDQ